jgi:hypothetical protein
MLNPAPDQFEILVLEEWRNRNYPPAPASWSKCYRCRATAQYVFLLKPRLAASFEDPYPYRPDPASDWYIQEIRQYWKTRLELPVCLEHRLAFELENS